MQDVFNDVPRLLLLAGQVLRRAACQIVCFIPGACSAICNKHSMHALLGYAVPATIYHLAAAPFHVKACFLSTEWHLVVQLCHRCCVR